MYKITLDVQKTGYQAIIDGLVTGDYNSRKVEIRLSDGGKPYIFPEGTTAMMNLECADGTSVVDMATVDNDRIYYTFGEYLHVGKTLAQVEVISEGVTICSPRFVVYVDQSLGANDEIINDERFPVLEAAIYAANSAIERAENIAAGNNIYTLTYSNSADSNMNEANAEALNKIISDEDRIVYIKVPRTSREYELLPASVSLDGTKIIATANSIDWSYKKYTIKTIIMGAGHVASDSKMTYAETSEVDTVLDEDSNNPVQNRVLADKFHDIEVRFGEIGELGGVGGGTPGQSYSNDTDVIFLERYNDTTTPTSAEMLEICRTIASKTSRDAISGVNMLVTNGTEKFRLPATISLKDYAGVKQLLITASYTNAFGITTSYQIFQMGNALNSLTYTDTYTGELEEAETEEMDRPVSVGSVINSIPVVPTSLADLEDDSEHRTVSDAEKEQWNGGGGKFYVLTWRETDGDTSVDAPNRAALTVLKTDYNDCVVYIDVDGMLLPAAISSNGTRIECYANDPSQQLTTYCISLLTNRLKYEMFMDIDDELSFTSTKLLPNSVITEAIGEIDEKIPTHLSQLTEDSGHRTVTDAEKALWNSGGGGGGTGGADGFSPTVTVQETALGHSVSITDKYGTQTFEVKDGKDAYKVACENGYSGTEAQFNQLMAGVPQVASNESNRITAEEQRAAAETSRATAENNRVAAENARATEFQQIVERFPYSIEVLTQAQYEAKVANSSLSNTVLYFIKDGVV